MQTTKYLITVFLAFALAVSTVFASTNYQAQVQAQESVHKNVSAVAIAKENTEQQRLKTLEVLSSKFDGQQALTAYIAEVLSSKIGKGASSETTQQQVAITQAPQELPECGFGCYLGQGVKGLFGLVERAAPVVLAGYQSRNQLISSLTSTTANRDIQINQQNSNASMFAAAGQANTNIAVAGFNTSGSIAGAGFNTVGGVAGAFAAKPSISITNSGDYSAFALQGSNAAVNGPVNTTVTCPSTGTANSTSGETTAGNGSGASAPGSTGTGGAGGNTGNPTANPIASSNCPVNK